MARSRSRLDMQLTFMECRAWGHAWEDFIPGVGEKQRTWGKQFHLRCIRCATTRHDTFDSLGDLSTRHYDYPDDYKCATIDERPTLQQLRLSIVAELQATAKRGNGNGHKPKARRTAKHLTAV